MAGEYIDDLKQNYRDLHESTGESYESMAQRVEAYNDKNLGAWLRGQSAAENAPDGTDPAASAPQGRQAPGNGSLKASAEDAAAAEAAAAAEQAAADEAAAADAAKSAKK